MIHISSATLSNGLRIVHHADSYTPMVAVDLLYSVGSRDEDPEHTGIAHLLEHMMFGGSANAPDFDRHTERACGWNNAWTSNDFTSFYSVVTADNIETIFWLESDRMLSPLFTPETFDVQRHVVIEEFKQTCLNRPYATLGHSLRSLLYKVHPYRWPTIGLTPDHIASLTLDRVREFFHANYTPDRAVLAVAGNIAFERVVELAEKWFGTIPRGNSPRLQLTPEPLPAEPRRLIVDGANEPQTSITIAYPMMAHGCEGYEAADIITDILAAGRASRFHQTLIAQGNVFTEADASILGSDQPGYIMFNGLIAPGIDNPEQQAEETLLQQIRHLTDHGITPHELQRAVNRFESRFRYSKAGILAKAQAIAKATMQGYALTPVTSHPLTNPNHPLTHTSHPLSDTDLPLAGTYQPLTATESYLSVTDRYRKLTVDQVNATARALLRPDRSATLIYRPTNTSSGDRS